MVKKIDLTRIHQYPKELRIIKRSHCMELRFYEYERNKAYQKKTLQYQVLYKIPFSRIDRLIEALKEEKNNGKIIPKSHH